MGTPRSTGPLMQVAYQSLDDHELSAALRRSQADLLELPSRLILTGYLLEHAWLRPGYTVLEVGAGNCGWLQLLSQVPCNLVALDYAAEPLAWTRRRLPDTIAYVQGDLHELPLGGGSVDVFVATDVLHHVDDLALMLAELSRVLRPGRRALFLEPGAGHAAEHRSAEVETRYGIVERDVDPSALARSAASEGLGCRFLIAPAAARAVTAHELVEVEPESGRAPRSEPEPSAIGSRLAIVLTKLP